MKLKNKKVLFICNTVYQVLVALWITHHTLGSETVDFIVSDHMNGGKEIADRINQTGVIRKAIFVQSHDYCYGKVNLPSKGGRYERKHPEKGFETLIKLDSHYDDIYVANVDRFAQLAATSISHTQWKRPKIILYEDGISTYSLLFKQFYESTKCIYDGSSLRSKLALRYYGDFPIYGNIAYALIFNPNLMLWTPSTNRKLDTIDKNDAAFLKIVNHVFAYNDSAAEYDRKYIFMEESYFADGKDIGDVEIIDELAQRVGKDNIMVKIHPRNPVNRFKELGYKTNTNTSIPWEVICMNMDNLSEKVLITIGSASVVMPSVLFGQNVNSFSLYKMLHLPNNAEPLMPKLLWEAIESFYTQRGAVKLCESMDDIVKLG